MSEKTVSKLEDEIRRRDEEARTKINTQLVALTGSMNRVAMDLSIIKGQLDSYEGMPAAITRLESRLEGYEVVSEGMTKMEVQLQNTGAVATTNQQDLKDLGARVIKLEASQVKKEEVETLKRDLANVKSRQDEGKGASHARTTLIAGVMSVVSIIIAIVALVLK